MQRKPFVTRCLLKTCLCLGSIIFSVPTFAETRFSSHPITNPVIAVAYPVRGTTRYQLQIYEQKPNGRQCWSEERGRLDLVKPLLMEFDFTGSCVRYIDGNGYCIRIGDRDMAREYRPTMQLAGANLCLMAVPTVNANHNPKILIGIGKLGKDGMVQKITFENSWQVSGLMFLGRSLGHVYIESKQSLALVSNASTQSRACKV